MSESHDGFTIEAMKEVELKYLFSWASSEGWRSEPIHIGCLFKTQSESFMGAYLDGRMIGMVMAVKQGNSIGVISNFFILEAFRGRGFGKRLFKQASNALNGRQIVLDSVIGREAMYAQAGFRPLYPVGCYRFEVGSVTLPTRYMEVKSEVDKERLLAFDARSAGYDRLDYLRCMLEDDAMVHRAIERDGIVSSYGLRFAYADGYKALLATSHDINESVTLLFALTEGLPSGSALYLSVSGPEQMLQAIVILLKMHLVSETLRMIKTTV